MSVVRMRSIKRKNGDKDEEVGEVEGKKISSLIVKCAKARTIKTNERKMRRNHSNSFPLKMTGD